MNIDESVRAEEFSKCLTAIINPALQDLPAELVIKILGAAQIDLMMGYSHAMLKQSFEKLMEGMQSAETAEANKI